MDFDESPRAISGVQFRSSGGHERGSQVIPGYGGADDGVVAAAGLVLTRLRCRASSRFRGVKGKNRRGRK